MHHLTHLWNQLPVSSHQPCIKHPADDVTLHNSSSTCSPLSPSITHSLFHSRLKTHSFHKYYSLFSASTHWTAFSDYTGPDVFNSFHFYLLFFLVMPSPLGGGIKRCFCLTSVAYIGPKSRTERHHHHHHSGLVGDVAVPVSARQVVLSCAFLNPDARRRLNGRRSASTVLSQVCLGRPGRRFQLLGVCHLYKFGEHGSDPGTCPPEPRGQTA